MNFLITGGAGFIPSSTAEKLLEDESNTVVLVDNFLTGKRGNIPIHDRCHFYRCDVNCLDDIAPIFDQYQFDYVFHYAAVVGVKRTLDNPIMVLDDIQGIRNILELSRQHGIKRVFYSSSSEVYGEPVHLPQNEETTPLNSRLPYAVVKNVGESYFRSYYQAYGLEYTIFRFFNTYGPKQSPDFVVSRFLTAAINGDDITIYGDGSQTRTFCFIDDNIEACLNTLNEPESANEVYNIGNEEIVSIKELAELILKLTNSSSNIVYLPPLEEGDMTRRQPDASKMKKLLNRDWISLEEGLKKIIQS
ncbi:MAG: NAD-dependent epimerase/dehydratase family protein [Bacteroidetes bacterium]|nr:MAG: NAD-dependent epimerase/dehydratase family protein [Bacteroidota bacterium]